MCPNYILTSFVNCSKSLDFEFSVYGWIGGNSYIYPLLINNGKLFALELGRTVALSFAQIYLFYAILYSMEISVKQFNPK